MAAAAEDTSSDLLECGCCYENDDLKRLPWSPGHIFCVTCITKDSEITTIIKCPHCRQVFDESIDDIPSVAAPLDKLLCCDVCMRKDDKFIHAQIYCVICEKKFCQGHMKSHNDALDDHKRITMNEYKKEYRRMETRYCESHTDQTFSAACDKCQQVFCGKCRIDLPACDKGGSHNIKDLEKLASCITSLVNEKKVWIFDKEECLLGMSKQLATIISDWDTHTEASVDRLHQARDKELEQVRQKYEELEKSYRGSRSQSKTEVNEFLDNQVEIKLNEISRGVQKIDYRVYTHHQVDVVRGRVDTEALADHLMVMEIPKYKPTTDNVELRERETSPDIGMEAIITAKSAIDLINVEPTKHPALEAQQQQALLEAQRQQQAQRERQPLEALRIGARRQQAVAVDVMRQVLQQNNCKQQ